MGQLIDEGINIKGYVFWTVSDNWEWADGYCPKFGLFSADRNTLDFKRTPRPSFHLFKTIVEKRQITKLQASEAWGLVKSNIGTLRPFCRSSDGKTSSEEAYDRAIVDFDWRFNVDIK